MSETKHQQRDDWDAAMNDCPTMYCGRLDMATWNAATGERQKMVYFDGEYERVVCEGRRADFVAYAANRYQPLVEELARLRQLNEDKHKHLEAYRKAASDDKAEIERLRQELDEARAAARRLLTVLANGDASVVQRGIEEYPWLEDTNE